VGGRVTGGGPNPAGHEPLAPGFNMSSSGRNENALTKTSWEGVGVKPDLATAADDALKVAPRSRQATKDPLEKLSERGCSNALPTRIPVEAAVRRTLPTAAASRTTKLQSPEMRQATRAQLPRLQEMLHSMGELQSVTFTEVGHGSVML